MEEETSKAEIVRGRSEKIKKSEKRRNREKRDE